ncbi:vesicular-fusion protein sec18 [Trichosporon asahii var. asahii CBS 2479]|uniref:Vesicular-fusion protein SEC18 n=1 Tax=Trichosporon asahii var. asahii (strain ATCC 90039 / CBS 2479 / JCM 2466 / KCTC 7840 / NBRC 103889/ NCYC 2677 / UAMH 7654) TaxID=1186058 RepID=J6F599_TRIAS|nr:vesicular-fusion protein sec18 [Trichosporon asahii var. asahii CBS 2479]EJT50462.1 vesicular-fusion protein sec18 [Trichosporon asahii var. asahii CBS 2479]
MSFFNRSNPNAPAARRAAGGAAGGGDSYQRIGTPDSQSHQPYRSTPPPAQYGGDRYSDYPSHHEQQRPTPPAPAPQSHRKPPPRQYNDYQDYPSEKQPEPISYQPRQERGLPQTPQHPSRGGALGGGGTFGIVQCPSTRAALTNRLPVNPGDFNCKYVIVRSQYVLATLPDPAVQAGNIGPAKHQRAWMSLSAVGESVDVQPYMPPPNAMAAQVELEVGFVSRFKESTDVFDSEDMEKAFLAAFPELPLAPGQVLVFDYRGHELKLSVRNTQNFDGQENTTVVTESQTEVIFVKNPAANIKLKSSSKRAPTNAILAPNFKFEDMGIGGLDTEFTSIFRRAFASRIFPPGLVDKLGIQHVKGILLYGPPGTGKTLMARQIGKMLNANEPKVVNGPEILNKFVGQSEENIRKLFADAEKEQREKGDESSLHIIIFDELDAICKQRGSTNSGTGVGDSIVNQLLSKMDGVEQLNNVLIIGMTNRMDMIDEALLRPGRLEVHIEISLPDEAGRFQILNIHTAKMRANKVMASDVDLAELAARTKNFSGAELNGLVKSATSFAFNRHVKVGSVAQFEHIDEMQITRADFLNALDEVQPAFGVAEEELAEVIQNGIIHYSPRVQDVLAQGNLLVEQVRHSERTHLVSCLIHGAPGAGKSALAASIAQQSEFPFIKLVSADQMLGMSEAQKVAHLHKVFSDAYKSPLSVVVVDCIERLLEYNPIGPRFSNGVLQALLVLFGKRPPKGRRLLVLATSSNVAVLREMQAMSVFDTDIRVDSIASVEEIGTCLTEVEFGDDGVRRKTLSALRDAGLDKEEWSVGVKKLLTLAEMARQDEDPGFQLASALIKEVKTTPYWK